MRNEQANLRAAFNDKSAGAFSKKRSASVAPNHFKPDP
jgi:hypothetical protein